MPMEPANHPTMLVLRALKLGDLLVAVPALKGLRSAFPKHRLLLAAPEWLRPIVGLLEVVDGLVPLPDLAGTLPRCLEGTDIAVNLHGNGSESRELLEGLQPLRLIGHAAPGRDGAPWQPEMQERERWVGMLEWHGITANANDVSIAIPPRPPVLSGATVIHVGASHGSRQWPVARFAAVAQTLQENGAAVVLTGDDKDAARSGEVARLAGLGPGQDLAGRLPLADFAALIASAAVVVSADTGAAHLASAYGTPSVVLFGPASQSQWGPPQGPHLVLTDETLRRGEVFSDVPDPALLAVHPQEVLRAVASLTRAVDAPSAVR